MAAITRYGFTGSMGAYGTFADKSAGVATAHGMRSRYRYRYAIRMFLFLFGGI